MTMKLRKILDAIQEKEDQAESSLDHVELLFDLRVAVEEYFNNAPGEDEFKQFVIEHVRPLLEDPNGRTMGDFAGALNGIDHYLNIQSCP